MLMGSPSIYLYYLFQPASTAQVPFQAHKTDVRSQEEENRERFELAKRSMVVLHINDFSSVDLEKYFNKYGKVEKFIVIPKGNKSFGKVRFRSESDANTAFNSGQIEDSKKSRHNIGKGYVILKYDFLPEVDEDRPNDPETAKRTLVVFHMDDFERPDLENHFNQFGSLENVKVFLKGKKKYARLLFKTIGDARAAYYGGRIEDHDSHGRITKQSIHEISSGFVIVRFDWMDIIKEAGQDPTRDKNLPKMNWIEAKHIANRTLMIFHISNHIKPMHLDKYFKKFGKLDKCRVTTESLGKRNKKSGWVVYQKGKDAKSAYRQGILEKHKHGMISKHSTGKGTVCVVFAKAPDIMKHQDQLGKDPFKKLEVSSVPEGPSTSASTSRRSSLHVAPSTESQMVSHATSLLSESVKKLGEVLSLAKTPEVPPPNPFIQSETVGCSSSQVPPTAKSVLGEVIGVAKKPEVSVPSGPSTSSEVAGSSSQEPPAAKSFAIRDRKLYLFDVAKCSEEDLQKYFIKYGTVDHVGVPIKHGKKSNRGYLLFVSPEQAKNAFLDGVRQGDFSKHQIGTHLIRVSLGGQAKESLQAPTSSTSTDDKPQVPTCQASKLTTSDVTQATTGNTSSQPEERPTPPERSSQDLFSQLSTGLRSATENPFSRTVACYIEKTEST
ncbi:uncharacterized protein [Amphiura filiformis]|uniref:uncharacterized protein n=1 Tax=Amphiura filiformis TaxID=82378 RepID=UPI003B21F8EA